MSAQEKFNDKTCNITCRVVSTITEGMKSTLLKWHPGVCCLWKQGTVSGMGKHAYTGIIYLMNPYFQSFKESEVTFSVLFKLLHRLLHFGHRILLFILGGSVLNLYKDFKIIDRNAIFTWWKRAYNI